MTTAQFAFPDPVTRLASPTPCNDRDRYDQTEPEFNYVHLTTPDGGEADIYAQMTPQFTSTTTTASPARAASAHGLVSSGANRSKVRPSRGPIFSADNLRDHKTAGHVVDRELPGLRSAQRLNQQAAQIAESKPRHCGRGRRPPATTSA